MKTILATEAKRKIYIHNGGLVEPLLRISTYYLFNYIAVWAMETILVNEAKEKYTYTMVV